jgi:hypothetical protein
MVVDAIESVADTSRDARCVRAVAIEPWREKRRVRLHPIQEIGGEFLGEKTDPLASI